MTDNSDLENIYRPLLMRALKLLNPSTVDFLMNYQGIDDCHHFDLIKTLLLRDDLEINPADHQHTTPSLTVTRKLDSWCQYIDLVVENQMNRESFETLRAIMTLIDKGADPSFTPDDGRSALDDANEKVERILLALRHKYLQQTLVESA